MPLATGNLPCCYGHDYKKHLSNFGGIIFETQQIERQGRGISNIYLPQKENDKFSKQKYSKDHVANENNKNNWHTPPSAPLDVAGTHKQGNPFTCGRDTQLTHF